jgi:hypothetical protein
MEIGSRKRGQSDDESELRYPDREEEKEPRELYGDDDNEQPRSSYRKAVEESGENDEDEAPRDRYRNPLQEDGDYDEDEERWHL